MGLKLIHSTLNLSILPCAYACTGQGWGGVQCTATKSAHSLSQIMKAEEVWDVAQLAQCLPSMNRVLGLLPSNE